MRKIGRLWNPVSEKGENYVQCHVCSHHCIIAPNCMGICRTRENDGGKLYTLVYGSLISRGSVDPIEKKPLYHFLPGSNAFSIATVGCNFKCKHCQNWDISQAHPNGDGSGASFSKKNMTRAHPFNLTQMSADQVIERAEESGCRSIAYTYNEPTIWFEFIEDVAKRAKEVGIKNILVTNGYSSEQANNEFIKYIDAANIDIKAFKNEFYKRIVGVPSFQPVLSTAKFFQEHGVHVEITYLIIPNENDNPNEIKQMCRWVNDNLGKETPLHFSAYFPRYRLLQPATSLEILEKAYRIAKEIGLFNVFLGNVRSDKYGNSYCINCGKVLISREGYFIKKENIEVKDKLFYCTNCGEKTDIVGM